MSIITKTTIATRQAYMAACVAYNDAKIAGNDDPTLKAAMDRAKKTYLEAKKTAIQVHVAKVDAEKLTNA